MLHITTTEAVETVAVTGDVPEHPNVKDVYAHEWSNKPIRPSRVKGIFTRTNGAEWVLSTLTVYGFDVLKSGKTSDNPLCWRDIRLPSDRRGFEDFGRQQVELTAWAYEWAEVELARLNEVTVRADLNSDVALIEWAADLDAAVCVDKDGEEWPEHDYAEIDCRRCGAEPEGL